MTTAAEHSHASDTADDESVAPTDLRPGADGDGFYGDGPPGAHDERHS